MKVAKAVSTLRVLVVDATKARARRKTADTWARTGEGQTVTRRKIETETTTVQVTRLMVDYALQQTSTMCGVALALREANPDWELPRVTQQDIRVTDRRTGKRLIWKTPPRVAKWIDKFDRQRETVGPMAFVLGEPDQSRPIKHRQPSEIIADSERFRRYRATRKDAGERVGSNRAPLPAGFTASRTRVLRDDSEGS